MPSKPPTHRLAQAQETHRPPNHGLANHIRHGSQWQRVRDLYRGQHPLCAKCGRLSDCVHHVKPLETHPELAHDFGNLASLCKACHVLEHGGKTVEMAIDELSERR